MTRIQKLLEIIGRALNDQNHTIRQEVLFCDTTLKNIAESVHLNSTTNLTKSELKESIQELISLPRQTVSLVVEDVIHHLNFRQMESERRTRNYLTQVVQTIQQYLRRPSDPLGTSYPPGLDRLSYEDWLVLLPDRLSVLEKKGEPVIEDWKLHKWQGYGDLSESWCAVAERDGKSVYSLLKWITGEELRGQFSKQTAYLQSILDLDTTEGIVPLESVYLQSQYPCLEYPYIYSYDLTGVMNDWRWRYPQTRTDQALLIVRRLARCLRKYHELPTPIVHGGLKPSNILIHPSEENKFALWISDLGWGIIGSDYSLQQNCPIRKLRQMKRGSCTHLYTSPERQLGDAATPRDDIYSLGMIWFQLLMRDPTAPPPRGTNWATPLRKIGFSDDQAQVLSSCLSPRTKDRPENATAFSILLDQLVQNLRTSDPASQSVPSSGSSHLLSPLPSGSKMASGSTNTNSTKEGTPGTNQLGTPVVKPSENQGDSAILIKSDSVQSMAGLGKLPASQQKSSQSMPAKPPSGSHQAIKHQQESNTIYPQESLNFLKKTVINSVGIEFVLIYPGRYLMGSPEGENGRHDWEGPQHWVEIRKPFYLSKYPITQAQYQEVMGVNPSKYSRPPWYHPDNPVESVTWYDAVHFCESLSIIRKEVEECRSYRLPTEAEWEYACRAGTSTTFAFGDSVTPREVFYYAVNPHPNRRDPSTVRDKPCKVGFSPANSWGLHDMHGLILEWCEDFWSPSFYKDSPEIDPKGPATGKYRVVRGGSFCQFSSECRSAARMGHDPNKGTESLGFRILLVVPR